MDVILDVDTGIDDALALLLACRSPDLTVRAVGCVAGNADVDQVVANTLRVLDVAHAPDIPVARGMARPLVGPPPPRRQAHGRDGMADLGLPASSRRPVAEHAVELMYRVLRTAPSPVTLVALAPLTNVAVLLRTHPDIAPAIERIVLVGGAATVVDTSAAADFNVRRDPEAAAAVLASGVPVTMYGLDVWADVAVEVSSVADLGVSDDPAQRLAGRLLTAQLVRYGTQVAALLGDAGAVAAVIRPAALTTARRPVRVELARGSTRGRTIIDRHPPSRDQDRDRPVADAGASVHAGSVDVAVDVDVAVHVDGPAYRDLFLAALRLG